MKYRHHVVQSLVLVGVCITGMAIAYFENAPAVGGLFGLSAVFTLAGLLQ